ncbi:MAG: DMT family transporter [Bacteroidota bacterium]
MNKPAAILLEALIAVFFFGCIAVVVRFVSANPFTIGIARLGIAVALLFPFLLLTGRLEGFRRRHVRPLVLLGVVFALHWLTFFFSIKTGSASMATIGLSTYGVHLILLGRLFGLNTVRFTDLAAVALAVAGTLLVVPEFSLRNREVVGLGLGVLSGFLYAFLPVLHQKHAGIPAFTRALGQFSVALLVFTCFWPLSDWRLSAADWGGLVFLALFPTLLSHTLWVRVTTVLSTATTSVLYYLYVPISLFLSVFLLGERVDAAMTAGAALIVGGNVLGVLGHLRVGTSREPPP